ncbi:ATP-binding protein [Aquabacterium lacunae]|nr:ATP-binding protein [Aquabacterium lacunae]
MAEDPQLLALMDAERLRMLFAPMIQITVVGSLVALALTVVVSTVLPLWLTLSWAAMPLLAGAVRLWLTLAFQRQTEIRHPERWLKRLTWVTGLNGLAWGLAAVMIMPVDDLVTSSVIVCTLVGAAALSCFTLQSSVQANVAMTLPLMAPTAVMLLSRMDPFGVFGGLGTAALGLFLVLEGRRAERRITELLWLRFTTDRISRERAEALVLARQNAETKDQFVATMSHEMRTPLHGILGLADVIQRRLPARVGPLADARQHAQLIQRSGQHLLALINDVLDFSRIEAGRMRLTPVAMDLHSLVSDVMALSRVTAERKGLVLEMRMELPVPCWVWGDSARLRQVLFNLIGNAVKFTDQGHVQVTAQRTSVDTVTLTVEDTGIGIPADMLDKVFDPFQQVDGSFGRKYQGTGLGLTISREIVRAMGGDLLCRSTQGKGSTFWLEVQLPPCAAPTHPVSAELDDMSTLPGTWVESAAMPLTSDGAAPNPTANPGLRGHVLLVEDNAVNALVAEATLHDLGLTVSMATRGHEALQMLTDGPHSFDVVLMDCQMPEMDGLEVTRRLRAHEREAGLPNVPVVALTANTGAQDRAQCTAAGMDDHLAKPFSSNDLAQVLQRHLVPRSVTA